MGQGKIIVGLSGGVDSAVAAYLLQQQGYQVEGLFMKNWEEDDTGEYCSAAVDLADAEGVCKKLCIPLHSVNFASEYWDRVFAYFLDEYRAGRTPNPDIMCNKEIKFAAFLDHARGLGADAIATGHYVQRRDNDGFTQLLRGADHNKDQSYFLYALDGGAIAQALFPVGQLHKPRVREIARQQGFDVFNKKDSTGICFIGERKFRDFLERFIPAQPGEIQTLDGQTIGEHSGLMFYTIGQRQGLGIGGLADASEQPWFVVDKDLQHNILLVVQGHDHPALFYRGCRLQGLHWINPSVTTPEMVRTARIRYRQRDQPCSIDPGDGNRANVTFDQPQRAVTPGQSIVFYRDEVCLGGGIIERGFNP